MSESPKNLTPHVKSSKRCGNWRSSGDDARAPVTRPTRVDGTGASGSERQSNIEPKCFMNFIAKKKKNGSANLRVGVPGARTLAARRRSSGRTINTGDGWLPFRGAWPRRFQVQHAAAGLHSHAARLERDLMIAQMV